MSRKKLSPGAELARLRWSKPDADRDQPRKIGKLGGRPRTAPRCPCGAMTVDRAMKRNHKCATSES